MLKLFEKYPRSRQSNMLRKNNLIEKAYQGRVKATSNMTMEFESVQKQPTRSV